MSCGKSGMRPQDSWTSDICSKYREAVIRPNLWQIRILVRYQCQVSICDHIRRNISQYSFSICLVCIATLAPIFPVRVTYKFFMTVCKPVIRLQFEESLLASHTEQWGISLIFKVSWIIVWRHFSRVKPFRVILKLVVYVRYFHFNRYLYFNFILFSFIGFSSYCWIKETEMSCRNKSLYVNLMVTTYKLEHHHVDIQSKKYTLWSWTSQGFR